MKTLTTQQTVSVLTILCWVVVFSNSQASSRAAIWDSSPVTFWSYWRFSLKICCCSWFLSSSRSLCLREIKKTTLIKLYFDIILTRLDTIPWDNETEEHNSFGSSVMYSQTRVQETNSKKTNTWITKQRSDCLWGCWRLSCYWSVKHAGYSPASGSSDPGQQLFLCSFSMFLLQSVVSLPVLFSKITPWIKFSIHWHLCYLKKFA